MNRESLVPVRPQRLEHNGSLDGVRFFAYTSVFLTHAGTFYPITGYGTHVFFVLSGFLIGLILFKQRASEASLLKNLQIFYFRRTLRVFPLYYAVLILIGVLQFLGFHYLQSKALLWQFFYLSNFYEFFVEMPGMTGHFWTLAIEEQFYLIVPLLMLFLPPRKCAFSILGLWILNLVLYTINAFVWHSAELRLLSNIQFGFIAMGIAVAFVEVEGSFLGVGTRSVYGIGIVSTIVSFVLIYLLRRKLVKNEVDAYMLFEWVVSLASAALILALWNNQLRPLGRFLSFPPFVYLGRISYGLYMYHAFVIYAAGHSWGGSRLAKLVAYLVTIVLAVISWHLFEKPINDLKRFAPYFAKSAPARQVVLSDAAAPAAQT
ncbi:MAG: acyltransferase [Planctomycetota bacterium]|nr:acyltransferase [Planctomycetota bacterium]